MRGETGSARSAPSVAARALTAFPGARSATGPHHARGSMAYPLKSQIHDLPHEMTSTTFDIPGYRVVQSMGVVRGVVVRSRSVFGTIAGGLQPIVGGNAS